MDKSFVSKNWLSVKLYPIMECWFEDLTRLTGSVGSVAKEILSPSFEEEDNEESSVDTLSHGTETISLFVDGKCTTALTLLTLWVVNNCSGCDEHEGDCAL